MLVPCKRCNRHISEREEVCPFCRHGGALARVGAAALSAGVLLSGCDQGVPQKKQETQGSAAVKRAYATVHGVVKDRAGKALAIASVSLSRPDGTGQSVQTDEHGKYTFATVEPGSYTMSVSYLRFEGAVERLGNDGRDVSLAAGDDKTVDFALDVRDQQVAPPYGAPPARRRLV